MAARPRPRAQPVTRMVVMVLLSARCGRGGGVSFSFFLFFFFSWLRKGREGAYDVVLGG